VLARLKEVVHSKKQAAHHRRPQRQGDSSWRPERPSVRLHSALPASRGTGQCPERPSENLLLSICHLLFFFEPHASESVRLETGLSGAELIRARLLLEAKRLLLDFELTITGIEKKIVLAGGTTGNWLAVVRSSPAKH
jgi:hypothetical protein